MGRTSNARERLLESAKELMHERGYAAVGVKEICERAGVNKGSFYHFFASKRALVLAVLDVQAAWYRDIIDRALAADRAPLDRLVRLFQLTYEFHDGRPRVQGCPIGNLALELAAVDEEVRQRIQDILDGWTGAVESVILEAAAAGDATPVDAHAAAQAVVAYLQGLILLAKSANDPRIVRTLARGALWLAGERHRRFHE